VNNLKKQYTERKYKTEYLKVKNELEHLIEHSNDPESWILPHGSKQLAGILNFTLQVIEENYTSYELKLLQLASLIHLLEKDCGENSLNVDFRGELYGISHNILHNTNKYEEWKHFSLAINDQYLM
jgi:hypothetical protein